MNGFSWKGDLKIMWANKSVYVFHILRSIVGHRDTEYTEIFIVASNPAKVEFQKQSPSGCDDTNITSLCALCVSVAIAFTTVLSLQPGSAFAGTGK